jgi:hypothetical protein
MLISPKHLLLLIAIASSMLLHGQVMINEVSSNNFSSYPDNEGDYDDWIELYNAGASAVNLNGYRLTDEAAVPTKWTFPNISIPAGGYLTVFASGKNRVDYIDHWESIVREGDSWKYTVANASTPLNWMTTSFNDVAWPAGPGGIGYADGDDATTVPNPTTTVYMRRTFSVPNVADIQYLMLHMDYDDGFVAYLNGVEIARSNITGSPSHNSFADADREAVMYLGGTPELFNIPKSTFQSLLVAGNNVLSVEVHNRSATSSDLTCRPFLTAGIASTAYNYQTTPPWFVAPAITTNLHTNFSIKESGEPVYLFDNSVTPALVSFIVVPKLSVDDTYGRFPNGSATWRFLQPATPNASNGTATSYTGYVTNPVVFSLPAGYYTGTQALSLTCANPAATIRFTIDGTKPTAASPVYTTTLSIPSSRVVRAAAFVAGLLPSVYETNSYFINDNTTLPVVSISTAPANFFDSNTGIYVDGPPALVASCPDMPYVCRNFWQDWEREIHIEYFDRTKTFQFEQDAGIKILGGWSRTLDMKSMQVRAGDRYGKKTFEYAFFNEPKKTGFEGTETFTLRNGGNDFNYTHLRDATHHRTLNSLLPCVDNHCDFEGYIPVLVYINGQYWGVHHLRERIDDSYFENNFGYDDDDIDYAEFNGSPKKGSAAEFQQMLDFVTNNDMTVAANYDNLQNNMLDVLNYVDYMCSELYHTNWDWPHNNIRFWQPKAAGGKWRFILHDTDFGSGLFGFSSATTNELSRVLADTRSVHSPFFQKLLTNTTFRNYFVTRFADLMNTIYTPANFKGVLNTLRAELTPEMARQFTRWPVNATNIAGWNSNVAGVETFMDGRPANMRNHIQSQFSLAGQVNVTLQVSPAGAGKIKINSITPCSLPWTGVYFNGVPVTVEVIPNDGYQFVNWSSGLSLPSTTATKLTFNVPANGTVTANFLTTTNIPRLCVTEINYNSDSASAAVNSGDWIELFNSGNAPLDLSGWVVKDSRVYNQFEFPAGTTLGAGQYLVLVSDVLKFQTVHPTVTNYMGPLGFNFSNAGETINIYDRLGALRYTMTYDDVAPWPQYADGLGATMELSSCANAPGSPASWFNGCKLGSPGTFYVPCPCQNIDLGPNAVLCVTGGSRVVTTGFAVHPNRRFTWYKDGVKLAATGPAINVTVPGIYSVLVDSLGCFKSDVINVDANISFDLGPNKSLCSPVIDTLNTGLTASGLTFVWRKNSVTIPTETTYKMGINTPGTYEVTVSGGSCAAVVDNNVVTSAAAVPVDGARCGAGVVNLAVTGTGTFQWYTTPTGGVPVATGTTYAPNLSSTTTFYVQDASFYANTVGPKDTTFGDVWYMNNLAGSTQFTDYKLRFNVTTSVLLNYVTVYTDGPQDVTIRVLASNGTTVLHTKTVTVTTAGKQRIPLGFTLATGTGFFMDAVGTTGSLLMNNENATFPTAYSVPSYISIYATSPTWAGNTNKWYFFFYNWEFSNKPGPCDRVPVTATINCVVPVELISFNAMNYEKEVQLTWETANEVNNDYFVVERSVDGITFEKVGIHDASNMPNARSRYFIRDANPANGRSYYRLRQVDLDGSEAFSDVISVIRNQESLLTFAPNPFSQYGVLQIENAEQVSIKIMDLQGRVLSSQVSTEKKIEIGESLKSGMYVLRVMMNGMESIIPFTKVE